MIQKPGMLGLRPSSALGCLLRQSVAGWRKPRDLSSCLCSGSSSTFARILFRRRPSPFVSLASGRVARSTRGHILLSAMLLTRSVLSGCGTWHRLISRGRSRRRIAMRFGGIGPVKISRFRNSRCSQRRSAHRSRQRNPDGKRWLKSVGFLGLSYDVSSSFSFIGAHKLSSAPGTQQGAKPVVMRLSR